MRISVAKAAAPESLASLAEAWLVQRGGWLTPRLPPLLRSMYDAEKGQLHHRSDVAVCVVSLALTAIFYPVLVAGVSNGPLARGPHALGMLYLGLLAPATLVSLIVVLSKPKPVWRELAMAAPSLPAMLICAQLFVGGAVDATIGFVAGTLTVMMFVVINVPLRSGLAVAWMAVAQAFFAGAILRAPDLSRDLRFDLISIGLTCGVYMLLACRRLHDEQQFGFVLALRERLRREALTAQNRALDDLVQSDSLTGLASRRAYDNWLDALWAQAASRGTATVGLIMIDVDHFKAYNDYHGHPGGDACLAAVGTCLREQLRGTSDQVARIGGEEFAVLLPGVALTQCGDIAERLRLAISALELPNPGYGMDTVVTISCGCASLRVCDAAPRDLCATADAALYQAKTSGRNAVCLGEFVQRNFVGVIAGSGGNAVA
jgi:diguanylate cyclase (GGDEF)-like protein